MVQKKTTMVQKKTTQSTPASTAATSSPGSAAAAPEQALGKQISQLATSLLSLRELVELAGTFLLAKASEPLSDERSPLRPLASILKGLTDAAEGRKTARRFEITLESTEQAREFAAAMKGWVRRRQHPRLLYRSALISLISTADWYVAQLLKYHYERTPGELGLREKVFSLEDLQAFGSVEDAKNHLIESKVESVLREDIEHWLSTIKTSLNLSMSYIDEWRPRLVEIAQRRNLVVHNNGVVNSIYLNKVAAALREGLKKGDTLEVTPQYLEISISLVERAFLLVGAEAWKNHAPEDETRARVLSEVAFDHLLAGRWDVAESLYRFQMLDARMSELSKTLARFNYWQAVKWQGRFDEVQPIIEQCDCSAMDVKFQAARTVLLDSFGEAVPLLERAVKLEQLSGDDLLNWPLFRKLRESERHWQQLSRLLPKHADSAPLPTHAPASESAVRSKASTRRLSASTGRARRKPTVKAHRAPRKGSRQ